MNAAEVVTKGFSMLFARQEADGTVWDVIRWWEKRRPIYLLILIVFCTCAAFFARDSGYHLLVSVILVVCSNFWYTGGWPAELLIRFLTRGRMLWFAPVMFGVGIAFSFVFCWYFLFPFPNPYG